MSKKLNIQRKDEKEYSIITVKGSIDEQADFKDTFSNLGTKVIVNLEGVEMINSCGVREWIQAIRNIPKTSHVEYDKCPPRIIEQINYISNFLGDGEVTSFYAPYFCPKEKKEVNILLTPKEIKGKTSAEAPSKKCPDCRSTLEFDDVEEEYFSFLLGK